VIVAVDGRAIAEHDELIQIIASRQPGTTATLQVVRDHRSLNVPVKLAERPREDDGEPVEEPRPLLPGGREAALGLSVRNLDAELLQRMALPAGTKGVVVSRVDPAGPAFDAEIRRGHVLLEINRRPVRTVDEYRRLMAAAQPGDLLTLYIYRPGSEPPRTLHTIKID
jgi:serine protease Do